MNTERRVKLGKVLIFVVLFVVFVNLGCASAATTYTVCPSGCDYASIQAAIEAADAGDTIEVHSGTYYENVLVNKQLILKGADNGGGDPVVDACGSGDVITLIADGITLEGFTTTNSSTWGGDAGVKVTSNNNIITGSTISNNGGFGIFLKYSSNNIITDDNVSSNNYDGIYLTPSSSNNTITSNNVSNNNNGIYLSSSCNNNTITSNNASSNCASGICLYNSSNNIITSNIASNNNDYGIHLDYSCNNNNITGNNASNNNGYGISLIHSSNNKIYLNNFINNNDGIYSASGNNIITSNNVSKNSRYGIYSSSNNLITGNSVSNNKYGIYLSYSYNSLIFHNNLINNSNNAYDSNPANNGWHHPVILEGNYWSDYTGVDDGSGTEKHTIADDGIGDIDISHPGTNYDNYPFMNESGWLIQREHDIAVTSIDAPKFAEPNSTTCINSTICNVGLNNESDIIVDFLVEGVSRSKTTIPFLKSWNSTIVSFPWTAPNVTGICNIAIYAEPVSGENITLNNLLSKNISVINLIIHNNNTGKNYSSIQAGIDDSDTKDGHTITVTSGIYYENVNVTKQLILRGADTGSGKPAVDAGGSGNAITLSVDGITLEGFTAINSDYFDKAGIKVTSNNNTIRGNKACNNYNGIYLRNSCNNTITGNTINNNGWDGIRIHDSCNNTITGNTASNNYNGIILSFSCKSTLRNNIMSGNHYNFKHEGHVSSHFDNDIDTSNRVDGKPIYYLTGASGTIIDSSSNASIVYCINCESVTVKDLILTNNSDGIYFYNTSNSSIQNNHISDNEYYGICLNFFSSNNTITGNTANNNDYGIRLRYSSNNTITGNNACNNRFSGIYFYNSSNNSITGNINSNNGEGIYLDYSSNNNITGNIASNNRDDGVLLCYSSNNNIAGNTARNNSDDGICLGGDCSNNNITGNTASNNDDGIYLGNCSNNNITGNIASNNDWMGIYLLESCNNNTITGNTVSNNNYNGIHIYSSSNNKIYLNNFINNADNVHSEESNNIWNSTEEIAYIYNGSTYTNYLGNYWSVYSGSDNDNDGIGDTPYSIYSNNDTYPLMQPWENYFVTVSAFDTSPGTYPSLMGTHTGIILPSSNLTVSKLYTYPCAGTGGHAKSIKLHGNGTLIANGTWTSYQSDGHNITINPSVILQAGHTYNYTIVTGSYPQILHATSKEVTGGTITCTSFVDANGNIYTDWIPAIRLG